MHHAWKIVVVLLALTTTSPSLAAEDFTFTAIGTDGGSAWIKIDGRNIGATSSTVTSTSKGPDGKTETWTGHCQSWTPDSPTYSFETVCNYTKDEGAYSTISWCPKDMTKGCSGKLVGVSGRFKDMTGTFSVGTKAGADGTTDNYSGTGHWN